MKFHVINCSTFTPPPPLPPPQPFIFLSEKQKFITLWSLCGVNVVVADLGEGSGGLGSPPLFLDQTEARGAKKDFGDFPTPLSQDLDDRPLLISRSVSST